MRSTAWKLQNLLNFDNLALKLKDGEGSQVGQALDGQNHHVLQPWNDAGRKL
jgi:hypothetical protein